MIYVKSILAGLTALLLALAVFVLVSVWPVLVGSERTGSGGIGFTVVTIGPLFFLVAVLVFAAGAWWQWRRSTR